MTREVAQRKYSQMVDDKPCIAEVSFINKIFDEHEAEVKRLLRGHEILEEACDVTIDKFTKELKAELNELKNRSCLNCKHWNTKQSKGYCQQLDIYLDIGGCGDYWEKKDD